MFVIGKFTRLKSVFDDESHRQIRRIYAGGLSSANRIQQ